MCYYGAVYITRTCMTQAAHPYAVTGYLKLGRWKLYCSLAPSLWLGKALPHVTSGALGKGFLTL